jgi:hypothetical protein
MKLFIIGNGFDLYHEIKSSYSDFKEYLFLRDRNLLITLEKFNLYGEFLWSDFEANLADLDEQELYDSYADSLVSYADDNWSDRYHHEFQYLIEEDTWRMTYGLKKSFLNWILNLNVDNGKRYYTTERLLNDEERLFLNFNYTNTLECKYGVARSEILYIHNRAENEKSDLIMGHAAADKRSEVWLWSGDIRAEEAEQHIADYYKNTYKSSQHILDKHRAFFKGLNSVDEIVILGHSISKVDVVYFHEIVKYINKEKVNWKISYYNEFDKKQHIETLITLGVCEKQIHQFELE